MAVVSSFFASAMSSDSWLRVVYSLDAMAIYKDRWRTIDAARRCQFDIPKDES
jgi:hypothetical protein